MSVKEAVNRKLAENVGTLHKIALYTAPIIICTRIAIGAAHAADLDQLMHYMIPVDPAHNVTTDLSMSWDSYVPDYHGLENGGLLLNENGLKHLEHTLYLYDPINMTEAHMEPGQNYENIPEVMKERVQYLNEHSDVLTHLGMPQSGVEIEKILIFKEDFPQGSQYNPVRGVILWSNGQCEVWYKDTISPVSEQMRKVLEAGGLNLSAENTTGITEETIGGAYGSTDFGLKGIEHVMENNKASIAYPLRLK